MHTVYVLGVIWFAVSANLFIHLALVGKKVSDATWAIISLVGCMACICAVTIYP